MAAVGQPWPFYRPERFSNGLQALVGAGGWEGEGGGGGRKGGGVAWEEGWAGGLGSAVFGVWGPYWGNPWGPPKKKAK